MVTNDNSAHDEQLKTCQKTKYSMLGNAYVCLNNLLDIQNLLRPFLEERNLSNLVLNSGLINLCM